MARVHDEPPVFPELPAILRAALSESELVVGLYDEGDVLRWANRAFLSRFLPDRGLPLSFSNVLRHGHARGFGVHIECGDVEVFLADVLARRRTSPQRAFATDLISGEWLWITETLLAEGWLLSIGAVITQLKQHERVLTRDRDQALFAAHTDPLTGVPNRRSILERGETLLANCQRSSVPFSVAAIDLDFFKQLNDRFGHDAGDEVLRTFASFCVASLRQDDMLGRVGGEEFLLLLPGTDAKLATQIIDRLRRSLAPAALADGRLTYTFSAGVASLREGEDLLGLFKRADRALYVAKAAGRNRTASDPPAPS